MVINARNPGETDAIIWQEGGARKHYRLVVKSASEHKQIVVAIKFAEVDRNLLTDHSSNVGPVPGREQSGGNEQLLQRRGESDHDSVR